MVRGVHGHLEGFRGLNIAYWPGASFSLYLSTFDAVMVNSGCSLAKGLDRKPLLSTVPAFLARGFQLGIGRIGIAGHFCAHRRQALVAQLVGLAAGIGGHDTGSPATKAPVLRRTPDSWLFHFLFVLKKQCLEVHADAERDEVTVIHGGVLAVEEVGGGQARGVGVLILGIQTQG